MSGLLADLLHGMLAEDPDHRPLPASCSISAACAAAASPPGRLAAASTPLMLNDIAVFDARMLAYALLIDDKKAIPVPRATGW